MPADVNGSRFQPSRRSCKRSPTILPGREVDPVRHGHGWRRGARANTVDGRADVLLVERLDQAHQAPGYRIVRRQSGAGPHPLSSPPTPSKWRLARSLLTRRRPQPARTSPQSRDVRPVAAETRHVILPGMFLRYYLDLPMPFEQAERALIAPGLLPALDGDLEVASLGPKSSPALDWCDVHAADGDVRPGTGPSLAAPCGGGDREGVPGAGSCRHEGETLGGPRATDRAQRKRKGVEMDRLKTWIGLALAALLLVTAACSNSSSNTTAGSSSGAVSPSSESSQKSR